MARVGACRGILLIPRRQLRTLTRSIPSCPYVVNTIVPRPKPKPTLDHPLVERFITSGLKNVLVLGASGGTGLALANLLLAQSTSPTTPKLTLYVRNPSKLPSVVLQASDRFHIVTGSLSDATALDDAMAGNSSFPPVDAVVSFLGAYPSLTAFLLRTKRTPIADSLPAVFAAMRKRNVKRFMALSTPDWLFPGEVLNWQWWLLTCLTPIILPQSWAEMKGIAQYTSKQTDLEWTVFRVPFLNDEDVAGETKVIAGMFGIEPKWEGGKQLSKASLARWVIQEAGDRRWVKKTPMVGNC